MALEIVNLKKVLNSCQQILVSTVGGDVIMTAESETRFSSNLRGASHYAATDRGRQVTVLPLPYPDNFWLNFSIKFNIKEVSPKRSNYYLDGVSVGLFYGQATDYNKLIMLRAEWDNKESNHIVHPQPHWHIHNSINNINPKDITNFCDFLGESAEETNLFSPELDDQVDTAIPSTVQPKTTDLSSFHYAMNAGWMLGQPYNSVLTENNLNIWLRELITHIRQQIDYCQ